MGAREELYAAVMSGGYHSPERSERASACIDAYRAEVLREPLEIVWKWIADVNDGLGYDNDDLILSLERAGYPPLTP